MAISFYFFELPRLAISIAAMVPSNKPNNIPTVTFLINLPTTIPVMIATLKAISLRVSIYVIYPYYDLMQSDWRTGDRRPEFRQAVREKKRDRCKRNSLSHMNQ